MNRRQRERTEGSEREQEADSRGEQEAKTERTVGREREREAKSRGGE